MDMEKAKLASFSLAVQGISCTESFDYSLSQNGWDTLGSPCPLNVGVQDLVTEPR